MLSHHIYVRAVARLSIQTKKSKSLRIETCIIVTSYEDMGQLYLSIRFYILCNNSSLLCLIIII